MSFNTIMNPYIIGTPIENPEMLFGRDSLFENIRDHLQNNEKFILLHGQRRIGKSSVLRILPYIVARDDFLFVSYDLQRDIHSQNNKILYNIISRILHEIGTERDIDISYLLESDSNLEDVRIRRNIYNISYELDTRGLKLILLLDEFDVIETDSDINRAVNFLEYLNNLIIEVKEIYLIAVVGRYINYMPNLLRIFRQAPFVEIGFLNSESAKKLIRQPAINSLQYRDETIERILNFSSGHPLYTQVLCYEIFNFAKNNNYRARNFPIIPDDVDGVIQEALQTSQGGCACFWDGLSLHERVVVSAIAQAQQENLTGDPAQIFQEYGLVFTDALKDAIDELIRRGFIDSNPIKIRVELVRLWLIEHHKLKDEIAILETIEAEQFNIVLINIARSLWKQEDRKNNALNQYELVLNLNPNHFSTIVELTGKYCELKDFNKALPLYEKALKLEKLGYQKILIEDLHKYRNYLYEQRDFEQAKQQDEKNLQIDHENSSTQEESPELIHPHNHNNESANNTETSNSYGSNFGGWLQIIIQQKLLKILGVSGLIAGFIAVAIIIAFNNQKDCPTNQQKNSQGVCVTNPQTSPSITEGVNSESLSSGDGSLFSKIKTNKPQDIDKFKESRQKGITNFQQKKYPEAAEDFEQAVKYNSNDPEVLIYRNNSLARQKGEPFVLAVVVPATHQSNYVLAWEILRGIAQAQNEFNKNQGLNGRLLEILIADDRDSPAQAQKVAQQIVDNSSVLGVIGHNASGVTTKALPIYEKAKIPIISSTSTSIDLTSSVFFRTLPSDRETGKKLAQYAIKKGLKQVLVLCNPDESYSRSIKEEFKTNLVSSGGKVIDDGCINIAKDNVDSEIVNNLPNVKEKVQAIALFPDTQHLYKAIDIAKKYKNNISGISLLGGDSVYVDDIFYKGGGDIEGLVLAVPWFRQTKKSQTFAEKAKKQWGGDVSWRTAISYDAVKAFLDSIDKSIKSSQILSRDTVLDNLKKVEVPETSFGETLKFNESRESQREVILLKVTNSQFRPEEEQIKK
ncbi:ABC transporter substrate-binding protein [Nostoc sp. CHAB 5784]|uniref:ABC transporter substrate-binding protein n=1 Tax=Nostoc mirabile TaxID=2907820 RepID=UPI001E37A08F|nr:ABC transporter substrate-binding protein [Nostoc mirabile]MCC5665366.1 ABC transporter substrate-binding protein [Nostoc mirabile CHAB5784]